MEHTTMLTIDESPRYKAILNPNDFDNAQFWKGIADYQKGKLEKAVIHAEKTVKSINRQMGPNAIDLQYVYFPTLSDMIYMLSGPRLQNNPEDEQAIRALLINCCKKPDLLHDTINPAFDTYGGRSKLVFNSESSWYSRQNVINPYPSFIGHWNFKLPQIEKMPLPHFWLSVLAMVTGALALIVAFAFLQAATMATTGVAVATLGAASLLGGFSIFCRDKQISARVNRDREAELDSWRPASAPSR